jgi:dihydroorotase
VATTAVELYTQVFDEEGALENLEAFASLNGANFYGLALNEETITLKRSKQTVPEYIVTCSGDRIVNFKGGEVLPWSTDLTIN